MAMLALQANNPSGVRCTPNVIPCRIHHNGPTKITKRFWAPSKDKDGIQTAHFRGRRLRGRMVKLPAQYQGMILKITERALTEATSEPLMPRYDEEDEGNNSDQEDPPEPVKILENIANFDEVSVWGHDHIPTSDDSFVRNIEEWINFAEAIHGSSHTMSESVQEQPTTEASKANQQKPNFE